MNRETLATRLRDRPAADRVITALDVPDAEAALALARRLGGAGSAVKVGLELFSAAGPEIVRRLLELGREVFLDLKFHDIPNTVAAAALRARHLGATLTTLHASGGRRMMEAAAEALAGAAGDAGRRPALLAVTILTSLAREDLDEVQSGGDAIQERIVRLAEVAWDSGCDGLVCSAADLPAVRRVLGPEPLVVTPGIRPESAAADDQRRVATPAAAVRDGADFLVIGRPITRAEDPAAALADIGRQMQSADSSPDIS